MMMTKSILIGAAIMLFASFAASFSTFHSRAITTMRQSVISKSVLYSSSEAGEPESAPKSKGFGAAKVKKEEVEEEKDEGTKTYESQAKRGVPEYNIFLRPKNGTEAEWVPVGSMTIPRDTPVAKAVFEVEQELLKGAFKLYPKMKAFYEVRKEKEDIFEYGHCLKAFPDEEIKIIKKEAEKKNFFSNWLGKLTDPMDTSDLKNKGQMTIKQ